MDSGEGRSSLPPSASTHYRSTSPSLQHAEVLLDSDIRSDAVEVAARRRTIQLTNARLYGGFLDVKSGSRAAMHSVTSPWYGMQERLHVSRNVALAYSHWHRAPCEHTRWGQLLCVAFTLGQILI